MSDAIVGDVLRQGFRFAYGRPLLIFLDLLWKIIWLALTLAGLFFVVVWFGSEFPSMRWAGTGNRAVNSAMAIALIRKFWLVNRTAVFCALALVLIFSIIVWFVLEAAFRSRIASASIPSSAEEGRFAFHTFLVSNVLKSLFIATAILALAAICFGRYFAAPLSEWPQLWLDTRDGVFISVVTVAALGFFLTILDTLVRNDAIGLLGTDLFRVTGLITILLSLETMIVTSCAVMLGAGLLNIAGLKSALAMLVATAIAVGLLNLLHSYLLLVRYSAVGILRKNVIEM